jgi:hypothetical protein
MAARNPYMCRQQLPNWLAQRVSAESAFGLFFTVDGGSHWTQLRGGMPPTQVRDLPSSFSRDCSCFRSEIRKNSRHFPRQSMLLWLSTLDAIAHQSGPEIKKEGEEQ